MSKSEYSKMNLPEEVSPEEYLKTSESYRTVSEKTPERVSSEEDRKPCESYEVGYKKPPKHAQFQKGVESVRKGRKKKSPDYDDIFWRVLCEEVGVSIGNKSVKMTHMEACIRKTLQLALNGNPKVLMKLLEMSEDSSMYKNKPILQKWFVKMYGTPKDKY